jgi:hypothetical protein
MRVEALRASMSRGRGGQGAGGLVAAASGADSKMGFCTGLMKEGS